MDIQYLKSILIYEPETGDFRWKVKRKRSNPGDVAGCINSRGYRYISIDNVLYKANRLAWFYVHAKWPLGQVDHINRDRLDDRIANLRDVTASQNQHNRTLNKNNKTGLTGAHVDPTGKWRSQISVNGKVHYLGLFDTREQAHSAYVVAKSFLHS